MAKQILSHVWNLDNIQTEKVLPIYNTTYLNIWRLQRTAQHSPCLTLHSPWAYDHIAFGSMVRPKAKLTTLWSGSKESIPHSSFEDMSHWLLFIPLGPVFFNFHHLPAEPPWGPAWMDIRPHLLQVRYPSNTALGTSFWQALEELTSIAPCCHTPHSHHLHGTDCVPSSAVPCSSSEDSNTSWAVPGRYQVKALDKNVTYPCRRHIKH